MSSEKKQKRRQKQSTTGVVKSPYFEWLCKMYPIYSPNNKRSSYNAKMRYEIRLKGFDIANCEAYKKLWEKCEGKLTTKKILNLGWDLAQKLKIELDIDAQNKRNVLIKWYDENWSKISEVIDDFEIREREKPKTAKNTTENLSIEFDMDKNFVFDLFQPILPDAFDIDSD
mgnify:CR=1 FL=1